MGHSMGGEGYCQEGGHLANFLGHGALSLYLKNPGMYRSASAFAPAWLVPSRIGNSNAADNLLLMIIFSTLQSPRYVPTSPLNPHMPRCHDLHTQMMNNVIAICAHSNPSKTPWGIKAFTNYLGPPSASSADPPKEWLAYDSTHLLKTSTAAKGSLHILVDVGTADDFLGKGQLETGVFEKVARECGRGEGEVQVRAQEGFNHSYYFVSLGKMGYPSQGDPGGLRLDDIGIRDAEQ
jgi:S-formylglutathione hydrolase FrmB